ncbi:MAG: hypothetical protein PHQ50_01475 [Eubacteriales bacterium]|nr:hypothetical protein [Eubacteriales bacterium]MDD3350015.1 hypothetical protein [Eubacteriales bacterium]
MKKWAKEVGYRINLFLVPVFMVAANMGFVFADSDATWNSFWTFICKWLIRIGAGIALVGAVQMAIGFKTEDPDARVRGLQTLVAGLMVAGIGAAPSLFGI